MSASYQVILLKCPQCTAPIGKNDKFCGYCQSELLVRSLSQYHELDKTIKVKYKTAYEDALKKGDDSEVRASLGICYLDLKLYDMALSAFENAVRIDPTSESALYYSALAIFRGRRPFVAQMRSVKKAEEYLEAGAIIGSGKCSAALAVIYKDFYEMKHLHGARSSRECLEEARERGLTDEDLREISSELAAPSIA